MEPLRGLYALGRFSSFYKGYSFCDFLFAFLQTDSLLKRDLLKKERISFLLEQNPFQKGDKWIVRVAVLDGPQYQIRVMNI